MNKRDKTFTIAAVVAASALALQVQAAGDTASSGYGSSTTAQSAESQRGVPGVDMDIGNSASDRGVPGVELNAGKDGDQNNVDTRTLGAGAEEADRNADMNANMNGDRSTTRPMRADRG